jgi:hypothetical protein
MVMSPLRTASILPVMCLVTGFSTVAVPGAQAEDGMHDVRYTVTSDRRDDVDIYYRDTDPPNWAAYSHDPYAYSPTLRAPVGPGESWTLDVTLADPASWAMVVAGSGPGPGSPYLRCALTVDGIVVTADGGPRGALCSLRHW